MQAIKDAELMRRSELPMRMLRWIGCDILIERVSALILSVYVAVQLGDNDDFCTVRLCSDYGTALNHGTLV